jgi:hypothetical protein
MGGAASSMRKKSRDVQVIQEHQEKEKNNASRTSTPFLRQQPSAHDDGDQENSVLNEQDGIRVAPTPQSLELTQSVSDQDVEQQLQTEYSEAKSCPADDEQRDNDNDYDSDEDAFLALPPVGTLQDMLVHAYVECQQIQICFSFCMMS